MTVAGIGSRGRGRRGRRLTVALLVLAGCHRGAVPEAPLVDVARVDSLLQDLVDRGLFQGAVVIGRGGRVEYAAGFGFADVERGIPFTPDTPMDGGSIAKPFTAAGVLLLAAEGRVDLDGPVRAVVPGYPHDATRVRHLLAHSAGLPSYEWLDARVPPGTVRTNASHLAAVARDAPAPAFSPGAGFAYDNVGYDVAAMVIERASGETYPEFLRERFIDPLGLRAFIRPARFADWEGDRTRGYERRGESWALYDAFDLEGFFGAANVYLSANDLHGWMSGYARLMGSVLEQATTLAQLDDGRRTGLSLGSWYLSGDGARRYYTGHHNGFYSFGYTDDARGLTVAWLANSTPPPWLQPALSRAIIAIAEGRAPEPVVASANLPVVDDPGGSYRVEGVGGVTVRPQGTGLVVRVGGMEYDVFPVPGDSYYLPAMDAYLRFRRLPEGAVALWWESVFVVPSPAAALPSQRPDARPVP